MVLLFFILIIIAGAFIGYRAGSWGTDRLNDTMRTEINLLKAHNLHWGKEARNKYELLTYISHEKTKDVSLLISNVIQLLQMIQREQGQNLSNTENEKINQVINQAKQVIQN